MDARETTVPQKLRGRNDLANMAHTTEGMGPKESHVKSDRRRSGTGTRSRSLLAGLTMAHRTGIGTTGVQRVAPQLPQVAAKTARLGQTEKLHRHRAPAKAPTHRSDRHLVALQ